LSFRATRLVAGARFAYVAVVQTKRTRVGIVGVSGFSGVELLGLLADHPRFEVVAAVADRWKGETLGLRARIDGPAANVVVAPMSDALPALAGVEVALLATPADVSAKLVPELVGRGLRVLDLSGAFRLGSAADYPRWYGFSHPAADLLAEARYGLPEVAAAAGSAPRAREARLVANPGCYATAAIVALAPLCAAGAIEPDVFVDGKSGVTGAGRKLEERLLFTEVAENLSAYRVGSHQHAPEMELGLSRVANRPVRVTFVPHLLPVRRGLVCTAYARLSPGVSADSVRALYERYYEGAARIDVASPEDVSLAGVVMTPRARVGARADPERGSVVAIGALDNLLKGAASQALQNLCEMVGVPLGRAGGEG